jgi:hypothetical protein
MARDKKSLGTDGKKDPDGLVRTVQGLVDQSMDYYGSTHYAEWDENFSYFENGANPIGPVNKEHLPIPLAWMVCDGVVSAMTDGRPKPVFTAEEKGDVAKADVVGRIITGPLWEQLHLEDNTEQVIKTALAMSGTAVTRVGVDQDGNLFDEVIDPKCCFPEPLVNNLREMEYFITSVPFPVGKIKRAFGSAADHVQAESLEDPRRGSYGKVMESWRWRSDYKAPLFSEQSYGGDYKNIRNSTGRAILTHAWIADYEEGSIPYNADETAEELQRAQEGLEIKVQAHENHPKHVQAHMAAIMQIQEMYGLALFSGAEVGKLTAPAGGFGPTSDQMAKDLDAMQRMIEHVNEHLEYPQADKGLLRPRGREVWICQGALLEDRASQFGNPYHAFQFDRSISGNFWGKSLMSYMVPVQREFEYIAGKIATHANLVANGRLFYNARLQIMWDKIKAKTKNKAPVGMLIPTNGPPAQNIIWDYGGAMPGYVFEFMMMLEQMMYKIGGYSEVMQGSVPAYASGKAIGQAIQSAGVRIRKGVKHLGWYYQTKFRDYIKYLKYADPTTMWRVIGKDNREEIVNWMDIDWDAMEDVRIDVRNVLGQWREEQFAKIQAVLERNPMLTEMLLPAMMEYLDIRVDTTKMNREAELSNALAVAHDELGMAKAQMK